MQMYGRPVCCTEELSVSPIFLSLYVAGSEHFAVS